MTDMMTAEKELEEQLKDAGSKLLQPPSSLGELLPLLDQVENFLSRVEQSPTKSMQAALSPLTNALVADELLRHSNVDAKVAVASCISEITRITAPDAPYDDDKMKEVFQLIVSSFEDLSDESSRSYNKRAMILETVAKVRSCVVMLDLDCDELIAEMFQLFLGTIRDYHPENIFSSMETIMTLVLEESEDISHEILTTLLVAMRKDNQDVLPVAVKLAEKVFRNCAIKLKPYISQTIKSLGVSLHDYSEVVASVCEGPPSVEPIIENISIKQPDLEDKLAEAESTDEAQTTQADKGNLLGSASDVAAAKVAKDDESCPEDVDHDVNRSPKSITINSGDDSKGIGSKVESSGNAKEHDLDDEPSASKVAFKPEVNDAEAQRKEDAESGKGRKPSCPTKVSESSDTSHVDGEKEVEELPDTQESLEKDLLGSPREDQVIDAPKSLEKEAVMNLPSPKASETEAANAASPSLSGSLHDESRTEKASRVKKKEISVREGTPSSNLVSKKTSEGTNDSGSKPHRHSRKKARADADKKDKGSVDVDTSRNLSGGKSDSEMKQMKKLDKKVDEISSTKEGYSLKRNGDSKKRGHGKAASEGEVTEASAEDDLKVSSSFKSPTRSDKVEDSPEETVMVSTKRKRSAGKDKAAENIEYGDNLVGLKVKVWWPDDHEFYEGVIESFDPVKKKHKVLYNDGDVEILNLRREQWEPVDDGSVSTQEQAAETASPDGMSGVQKRKKAKRYPESSVKQEKTEVSPKSGASSSSKSKGTGSGRKTEDDSKLKDKTPKFGGKSEDDSTSKSKSHPQRSGDKHDDSSKTSVKSKDVASSTSKAKSKQDTPMTGSKSKQDTSKTDTKPKGKTPQAGGDGGANGMGKIKHSSSKIKETGDFKAKSKEKPAGVPKTPEGIKVKLPEMSKVQEIGKGSSTKKRRRAG